MSSRKRPGGTPSRGGDEPTPPSRKKRKSGPKKRRFRGNQYTRLAKMQEPEPTASTSAATEGGSAIPSTSTQDSSAEPTGYRLMDIEVLSAFVKTFPCRSDGCGCNDYAVVEKRIGLSFSLVFTCKACGADFKLSNTKEENVNVRFAVSIFSIGGHYEKGKKFLANMNMPPPVSAESFGKYRDKIADASESIARDSMAQAASEYSAAVGEDDVVVSCDGTWQKRGFVSKNGVATVLSGGVGGRAKVLDVHVSSNHCDACLKAKKRRHGEAYQTWYEDHKKKCSKNHEGTSGAMEPQGMLKIFRRSQERYGLKYTKYLGDGDSKSFHAVSSATPPVYDEPIEKLECCGHVQKRMGKKLMDKVSENKNKEFTEGGTTYRGIGGKARLTQNAIKIIQGHYGAAIRGNVGNKEKMKKAIWAIWKHRGKIHDDCGSWCPAQQGDLDKANEHSFPNFVLQIIKPVFEELSSDKLLDKCLHGGTQNVNESFHSMIWQRCPKTIFVGRRRLELAVYDAAIVMNDGEKGRLNVFSQLGLNVGDHMINAFERFDSARKKGYRRQATETAKRGRKQRKLSRASKKGRDTSYEAGAH